MKHWQAVNKTYASESPALMRTVSLRINMDGHISECEGYVYYRRDGKRYWRIKGLGEVADSEVDVVSWCDSFGSKTFSWGTV